VRDAVTIALLTTGRTHFGVAVVLGGILFVASSTLPNVGLLDREQVGDTPAYERFGEAIRSGEVPYRDFYLEYPPGALPVFVLPTLGPEGDYALRFKLLALVLGIAAIALVALALSALGASRARVLAAAAFVGVTPALLGPVVLVNYDLWPAVLALAALAALLHGRGRVGLAALGVATAAKLFAVVLLPLALLHVRRRFGSKAMWVGLAACTAAFAAIVLPFVVLAPGGVGNSTWTLLQRGLQIETLGSSLLLAVHQLGLYKPTVTSVFNSQDLAGSLPDALAVTTTALTALTLVAVWHRFWRCSAEKEVLAVASAAALTAAVAFGKVLSPQFLVWLLPFVPLVRGRRGLAASALFALALGLTQLWFPSRYGELVAFGDVSWFVLARNLVLVALFAVLVLAIRPAAARRREAGRLYRDR